MNSRLILVKHSLPEIKKDLPAREWTLSPEGRARADRLAERLSAYPFEVLFSSPEPKALETAQLIAVVRAAPVQVVKGLHEQERSGVPFLSPSELQAAVETFFEYPADLVFGGETADQAHERFSRAVYSVLSGKADRTTIIVSHGTVISLFVSRLTGQSGFHLWRELGLPGFVILDIQSKTLLQVENIL